MIEAHVLIALIVTVIIQSVDSCGGFARESFTDPKQFCDGMKQCTRCVAATHDSIGSPFGRKGSALISKAVKKGLKKLCNADCKITVEKNVPFNATLLPLGDALKVCVFDLIIKGGGKKGRTCSKLEETARCVLEASTGKDYLLTNDVIDVGTYVLSELVQSFFGVECTKPALEKRIMEKCIGSRQARKYNYHA